MIKFQVIFLSLLMNKIIVGILIKSNDYDEFVLKKSNLNHLYSKCTIILIPVFDNYDRLDLDALKICDMIIIPGGSVIYPYYYEVIDYALVNHIPLLGICLGMQALGLYSTTKDELDLLKVDNHYLENNKKHEIIILSNTILNKLFLNKIKVNSRHHYILKEVEYPFIVSAYNKDGTIEAIEYSKDDNLMIGVQFHPEDLDNMSILYDYFIAYIIKKKLKEH